MKERDLQRSVEQLAKWLGWRVYHTHDSRRSEPGFPDLVMVHPQRGLLFRELKAGGRLTQAQRQWLEDLVAVGQNAQMWNVDDWTSGRVLAELKGE